MASGTKGKIEMAPLQKCEVKKYSRAQLRAKPKLGVVLGHTCDPSSLNVDSRSLEFKVIFGYIVI